MHRVKIINIFFVTSFLILLSGCGGDTSDGAFARYKDHKKFDQYFTKYSKRYFGAGFDWTHFKAQAIAESNLNTKAKSYVGAVGLMQIMPATFEEISKQEKYIKGNSKEPRWNISAGIYYNRKLWDFWKADRTFQDRLNFMFASYNAGRGNIRKAQRLANAVEMDTNQWITIEKYLPKVTGKQSKETLRYVDRIQEITEDIQ